MLKTTLYLGALTGLLIAIGFFLAGTGGMLIGLAIAGAMNFFSYYYSDKIILKVYNGRKVDSSRAPELHEIVEELAKEKEIPKPNIYLINLPTPNAFATGRNPENACVAVSKSLLDNLDKGEIKAVLAHELTHIKNRDTLISTVSATLAGAVAIISRLLFFTFLGGRRKRRGFGLLFIILVPFIATLIRLAVSRSREYKADEGAAKTASSSKMISALKKINKAPKLRTSSTSSVTSHLFIENPFKSSKVMEIFSTHPSLENRIKHIKEVSK